MKKHWIKMAVLCGALLWAAPALSSQVSVGAEAPNTAEVTLQGQFEGAYDNEYPRFVTPNGNAYPVKMNHAGRIASYTPFEATGYMTNDAKGQTVFVVKKVHYTDPAPNEPTKSYIDDGANMTDEMRNRVIVDRDQGYFHEALVSDSANYYQQDVGRLTQVDLSQYHLIYSLDGVPVGSKVYTLGSLLTTASKNLMNFRTANGSVILVNLNGCSLPMGQRATVAGVVTAPGVLTLQLVSSVA
ncbi:MAG: hypothetical protein SOY70_05310 [Veillonellaceae bacterium]|nr:hypothetical protein [Veillonellaceae bacterium]